MLVGGLNFYSSVPIGLPYRFYWWNYMFLFWFLMTPVDKEAWNWFMSPRRLSSTLIKTKKFLTLMFVMCILKYFVSILSIDSQCIKTNLVRVPLTYFIKNLKYWNWKIWINMKNMEVAYLSQDSWWKALQQELMALSRQLLLRSSPF